MKTTIDLPAELVRKLKLRAVHDGRKLKDVAAEMLRSGLAEPSPSKTPSRPVMLKDKKTGLPVIQAPRRARGQLTPEDVARILAEQEIEWTGGRNMILPDTNVWLALAISNHEFHSAARDWFAARYLRADRPGSVDRRNNRSSG